jgi:hypothetical protein
VSVDWSPTSGDASSATGLSFAVTDTSAPCTNCEVTKTFSVTVSASSNGSTPINWILTWTVKHPCENATFSSLTLPNLLRYVGYGVKSTASSSIHAIVTSSDAACTVAYEGQSPIGSALTTISMPIKYTAGTRTLDYDSATIADVGAYHYTLKVYFAECSIINMV